MERTRRGRRGPVEDRRLDLLGDFSLAPPATRWYVRGADPAGGPWNCTSETGFFTVAYGRLTQRRRASACHRAKPSGVCGDGASATSAAVEARHPAERLSRERARPVPAWSLSRTVGGAPPSRWCYRGRAPPPASRRRSVRPSTVRPAKCSSSASREPFGGVRAWSPPAARRPEPSCARRSHLPLLDDDLDGGDLTSAVLETLLRRRPQVVHVQQELSTGQRCTSGSTSQWPPDVDDEERPACALRDDGRQLDVVDQDSGASRLTPSARHRRSSTERHREATDGRRSWCAVRHAHLVDVGRSEPDHHPLAHLTCTDPQHLGDQQAVELVGGHRNGRRRGGGDVPRDRGLGARPLCRPRVRVGRWR